MILSESQVKKFIEKLVNDDSISDNQWENAYQHLRDDLCFYNDECDLDKIHYFHWVHHRINVKGLAKKYEVI